nr:hypothetical protein [Streptomyces sp. A3M-1-3]
MDQLSAAAGEFAQYLRDMTALLDQGGGWCGVFWQRDPGGMRACLDGHEVPPWDVVESLLQDLAGRHGAQFAEHEAARAGRLHAAAVAVHDQLSGGAGSLRDRLEAVLRERTYAEERQRELAARLRVTAAGPEAESLGHELAWAQDDVERATVRCAEFRTRLAALTPPPGTPGRPVAPESWFRAPDPAGEPWTDPDGPTEAEPARGAGQSAWGPGRPTGQGAAPHPARWADRDGAADGTPAAGPGAEPDTARWASDPEGPGGTTPGQAAPAPEAGASPQPAGWADRDGPGAPVGPAPAPERGAAAYAAGWAAGREGSGASAPAASAPQPGAVPYTARWAPDPEGPGGTTPGQAAPAPEAGASPQPAGGAPAGPVAASEPGAAPRRARWAPGAARRTAPAPDPAPHAATRRRRSRGARFAGLDDEVEVQVAPVLPEPVAPDDSAFTPRGARYRGLAPTEAHAGHQAEPEDAAEARKAAAAVVAELIGLRAEGRSGEAHVVLCQAAVWPPARLPLLAVELHRAGLAADWATLLWEAASLPPDRLAATAAALAAAGRDADCGRLLRQGVSRPAAEIAAAALALAGAGREPEARALLDAFIRVRTPEEAAQIAQSDPQQLVPQLLAAADAVSDACRRDLLHALRVAGVSPA